MLGILALILVVLLALDIDLPLIASFIKQYPLPISIAFICVILCLIMFAGRRPDDEYKEP